MATDITQTGLQTWRDLQKQNAEPFDPSTATAEDWYKQLKSTINYNDFSDQPTEYVGLQAAQAGYGDSRYDEGLTSAAQFEDLGDIRYENQSWYDTLANGIGKMLGTAGTTFVSSLVGLPYGLFEAANQGRWSALWDNDVTQGLSNVDKWLEENMVNYRSQVQQNSPWYSPDNLFSMNFIADDVIKNAGFTLGAAASMAVGSGSLGLMSKALGFTNEVGKGTKIGMAALSSLFSATGEGMIEAKQGVEERNKLEIKKLEDSFVPEYNALDMMQEEATNNYRLTGDYNAYKQNMQDIQAYRQELDSKKAAGLQQIEESGQKMGNTILLANQALLTVGNLIQFGKGMVKSFDSARHAAEVTAKAAKPFGVGAVKAGADLVGTGYKVTGKTLGKTLAATKGILTEGSEEMNQQWIQSGAGAYYNREDVNDYWKAKMDPEATKDTTEGLYTFGKALDRGFQESWGDVDQWEQFVIGGLTGMAGSYSPTKLFNQDKTKGRLDPRRYGSWEGGAYNELKDFNKQYSQYEENINEVNKILQSEDFPARVMDMVGHTYTQSEMTNAAEADDKKAYKDAEDKQFVHDIQSFLRAGKLDDLRAIYKSMSENLSDEDVENIIKNTTKEVSAEEDKQNHDRMMDARIAAAPDDEEKARLIAEKEAYSGKPYSIGAYKDMDGNTMSYDRVRETVKHNAEELNRKLDSYLDSIDMVNKMTKGRLTKDQEDNLVYLHNLSKEKINRFDKILSGVRKKLPSKFLIKTEKSPEQLSQETASSDLSFIKDENTPKGYVEVDTSLMNDKAFGNFFMNTVMYGDNIDSKDEGQAEKDRDEQQKVNVERYKKNFYDTMRNGTNMTLEEIRDAFNDLRQDIYDASVLQNDSQEFWNTYMEYMTNPNKVDQAKETEEKKVVKEQQKKDVQQMSARELAQRTDLKELLAQAKADSDIPMINKIKKAILIRQQKAQTSSAGRDKNVLSGYSPEDKEMAIQAQMAKLDQELDRIDDDDEKESTLQEMTDKIKGVDMQTVDDIILANLNPVDKARLMQLEQDDPDAFEKEMAERENRVLQALDELETRTMQNLPDFDETRVEISDKDLTDLAGKVAEENPEGPAQPKRHDEVNPVISVPVFSSEAPTGTNSSNDSVSDASVLEQDMKQGMEGVAFARSGQHPWRAVTRRVGYKTNEPYSQTLERVLSETTDETKRKQLQKQLQRAKAVENLFNEKSVFSRVEQGGASRNKGIKFAISKKLNDEAGDFVILITDMNGIILGDMPSSDIDIEPTTNQITGLAGLYEEARRQWDNLTDEEKDTTEFIPLNGLQTKIDYSYFGKVRYQDERQSVNELFGDEGFTLALRVGERNSSDPQSFIDTGKKSLAGKTERSAIREPLTGAKGQPYVLIPTSKSKSNTYGEGYLAVPILTPAFGELSQDSQFYRVVRDILERIRDGKVENKQAKELLQVLFGVDNVHVNFDGDQSKKGSGITVTTFTRANQSEKGNPHDIFKGKREDLDVDAALEALGRFFVNIANKKINTSETFYTLPNGEKVSYNRMIGEIATTNAAMPHTVNDFFTVVPLENKDGKFEQVTQKPPRMKFPQGNLNSVFHVKVKYKDDTQKMWSIDPSENFVCRDEQGRPIYKEDNVHTPSEKKLAAQYRAEAFGRFYMKDFSKPFAVMIDDKTYLYDPVNKTFKTVQELEKTAPRYNKNLAEYDRLEDMLQSMEEARLEVEAARAATERNAALLGKFGSAITDYSYGAQDGLPTFYGTIPSTGERIRIEVDEKNSRYTIWIDRALPGQTNYEPGKGISYNLILEGTEEEYDKVLKELGLPKEFIDDIPKLHELNKEDVRNNTDKKDEYLKTVWGIEYGHNAPNYKNINKVNAIIRKLQEDGSKYELCDVNGNPNPEGNYYKDENGLLHARVTSMAEGDPMVEPFKETLDGGTENPWILPSTTIGNQVDEFIRAFFEGGDPMSLSTPNLSQKSKEKLLEDLRGIQEQISKQGWKVASRNIVASGVLGVTDANGDQIIVRVAGTLDLLLYNPEKDEYAIYDIKTHRRAIDFNNVEKDSHMGKWSAQLSLYKEMLEAKYPELRGKIKGLKILPIKVSSDSYDADRHKYSKENGVLVDENKNTVSAEVVYDGQTIPIRERSLNINMGKKGFKTEYNKEGKKQIIVSKPRALPGEAPKQKVKEGLLQTINKVAPNMPMQKYLKDAYKNNPDALALCATLDEARKNGTLADLMLTEATTNMLSDMLNDRLINNHAARAKLNLEGLQIPGENNVPEVAEGEPGDASTDNVEEKARQRKILDNTTEKAWNRLTEKNKKKAANAANVAQVKKSLQDAQKNPRKDPNQLISPYLHRKAVDTRGYRKLDMNKELEWLNKVLPQVSRLNKVKIIQGLIRCSDGTWDYGQLRNGLMYLGTNGKEGTVYHEAFHAVTQWILTDKELDALYEAARERYGNLDTVTLEEKLADDFMQYTMGVRPVYKPKHQGIFKTLWNAIKKMFGHTSMIDKLYQNINDGVYAGAVLRMGENEFADIQTEDREASMQYQFLDREQRDKLKENNISRDQYEVLDSNDKRYLFHCVL